MESLTQISEKIIGCRRCPRLRQHCMDVAQTKKREFRDQSYWGRPVPGFGDPRAQLWVVGLAPAAHGANRTGRMFTGDSSGRWLYNALYEAGFANQPTSDPGDALKLMGAFVSSAGRCAPPDNKPTLEELKNCESFLDAEFRVLKDLRLILALGGIAFRSVCLLLEKRGTKLPPPKPKFAHHKLFDFGEMKVLTSYHPSRQNTQTRRLTESMWKAVFEEAAKITSRA